MRFVCNNCDCHYEANGAERYVVGKDGVIEKLTFLCLDCKLMFEQLYDKKSIDNPQVS